jgi:hypothetical protein
MNYGTHAWARGITIPASQIAEWAGVKNLTDEDLDRLADCIPHSSVPEALGVIVNDALGVGEREDEAMGGPDVALAAADLAAALDHVGVPDELRDAAATLLGALERAAGPDPYRDADNFAGCPRCGDPLGWNSEDGLAGQTCGECGYSFTGKEAACAVPLHGLAAQALGGPAKGDREVTCTECGQVKRQALPKPGPADLLETIADLRGSMVDGYRPEDVNRTLSRISDASGLRLVCVWDIYDSCGPGGNSQFYVEEGSGRLRELAGDLWRWLNDDPDDPDALTSPGTPGSWIGDLADFTTADPEYDDGFCNYALRDTT